MMSSDGRSKDVLAYFRELAEGSALKTDEDESLMAMKYRQLDIRFASQHPFQLFAGPFSRFGFVFARPYLPVRL